MQATTFDVAERHPGALSWVSVTAVAIVTSALFWIPWLVTAAPMGADAARVAQAINAGPPPPTSLPELPVPDPIAWPGTPPGVAEGSSLMVLRHHAIDVVDLDTGATTRLQLSELERWFPGIEPATLERIGRHELVAGTTAPPADNEAAIAVGTSWLVEGSDCTLGTCELDVITGHRRTVPVGPYALATPLAAAYSPASDRLATFVDTRQGDRAALVVIDEEGLRHFSNTRPVIGGGSGLLAWSDDGSAVLHTYRGDSSLRAFSPDHPAVSWSSAELRLTNAVALRFLAPGEFQSRGLSP